jgi:flagellar motor switch protein FliG
MKDDSQDEKVDGAKIAAQILNRMAPEARDRIMKTMQASSPAIAQRVEENLFNFDDIADVTPQGIQLLIAAVEQMDLVRALKGASPKVKEHLFANMSERRQKIFKDELEALPPTAIGDISRSQQRIMVKLDELRSAGSIKTMSKQDVWV